MTGRDYTEEFLIFIRDKKRRSNVMTQTRIQPFRQKHNNKIVCLDGSRINLRNTPERKVALIINKVCFFSIWNSNGISFNKAIEELKLNYKVVDAFLSDKRVKSFIQNEHKSEYVQSQSKNTVFYVIETLININCVPYACFV